jgi:adenylate cyclase, class 2
VTKRRRLFLHRNVRIHLDDVEGLGTFVELESVLAVPGNQSADEARALAEVVAALGLAGRETIAGGYLELSQR